MAIDKNRKIAMYQNRDYKTKVIKPGLRSVKITAEQVAILSQLKEGDTISYLINDYKKEEKHPEGYVLLPDPIKATTSNDF